MATIVDSLVVLLNLDRSGFKKGEKEQEDSRRKMRQQADADRKAAIENNKRIEGSFKGVTNSVIELAAVVLGTGSLIGIAKNAMTSAASVGYLAKNLDTTTQFVSTLQEAVKQMGGTAADADASITSLAMSAQQFQTTGRSPLIGWLQKLGITDASVLAPGGLPRLLDALHDRFKAMDPQQAFFIGQQMGLSPALINLLTLQDDAYRKQIASAERSAAITEDQARRAQELQQALAPLVATYQRMAIVLLTNLAPALISVTEKLEGFSHVDIGAKRVGDELAGLAKAWGGLAKTLTGSDDFGAFIRGRMLALGDYIQMMSHLVKAASALVRGDLKGAGAELKAAGDSLKAEFSVPLAGVKAAPQTPGTIAPSPANLSAVGRTPNTQRMAEVVRKLEAAGYPHNSAVAMAAVMNYGESGLMTTAYNPAGGGHGARGIAQWRDSGGLQDFRKMFGVDMLKGTLDQQLTFLEWQLKHNPAHAELMAGGSVNDMMRVFASKFERGSPSDVQGDIDRASRALVGTINIYETKSPRATAQAVTSAIATQANRGLG